MTDEITLENLDYEETVMKLIIFSGEGKSLCFEALQAAKKQNFEEAEKLMNDATAAFKIAHEVQTMIIGLDLGEGKLPVHLIMVHAQDHLMTGMLAKELITEIIELHKSK